MKKSTCLYRVTPVVNSQRPIIFLFAVLLTLLILPLRSFTQTLDDFKKASEYNQGVELIPFKDLRVEATGIANEVDLFKKKVLPYNADEMKAQKANLLKKINSINDDIKAEEDIAKKYKGTTPDKRKIDKLKAERAPYDTKLKKLDQDIEDAYDAFERLYNARAGLREKFDDVLRALDAAADHPEKHLGKSPPAADVAKLKKYIETIVRNIKSEEAEHKRQEDGARNTKEKLEEIKDMS